MRGRFYQVDDWRLPLIFAAPVLLVAVVGYLALQPPPGSATSALTGTVTIHENVTPRPSYVPTPYPSVAPPTPGATPYPCGHPIIGYITRTENGVVVRAMPGTVCQP